MAFWIDRKEPLPSGTHLAFRGTFALSEPATRNLETCASGPYLVWIDGELVADGPARFAAHLPERVENVVPLLAGYHTILVHVVHDGIRTNFLPLVEPFCEVGLDGLDLEWEAAELAEYRPGVRRLNPCLGWIEWREASKAPEWQAARSLPDRTTGTATLGSIRLDPTPIRLMDQGVWAQRYGYAPDDPPVRFFLRDLDDNQLPADGVWARYDLGKVRLGRPDLTLDAPAGSVVEVALCEELRHGRVHPWVGLSGPTSCNLHRYLASGGRERFVPVAAMGGRYMEVHVEAPPSSVHLESIGFRDRTYYGEPEGSFRCSNPRLDAIWKMGLETVRSCVEDAPTDCPTRERGQWLGDSGTMAMESAAAGFGDLRPFRRALVQAAQCARDDGLVAGLYPGNVGHLPTYSAQWFGACLRYRQLTGDRSLLDDMLPAAQRNEQAFLDHLSDEGVSDMGWAFVDWGYVRNEGPTDMGLNLAVLMGLRKWRDWQKELGIATTKTEGAIQKLETGILSFLTGHEMEPERLGFQVATWAMQAGLIPENLTPRFAAYLLDHVYSCFPLDPDAPRLAHPDVTGTRFITPFFLHFTLGLWMRRWPSTSALKIIEGCWGWMLDQGYTTCLEVFDPRWSHCHQWSSCPTWLLSRYVLGLHPRFDRGARTFDFLLRTGDLEWASGTVPCPGSAPIGVSWKLDGDRVAVQIESREVATLVHPSGEEVVLKPGVPCRFVV